MNLTCRLTLSFLIVICFAGLTTAHDEHFAGRTVEVQARVVAINADGQSLELYDSPSHTRVSVQLAQLPQAERAALMCSDVRESPYPSNRMSSSTQNN